jgi:glyoxylase-like metal-dependent hydrolase (beta-lactamase superfamily II)
MQPDEVHLQNLEIVSFVLGLADTNAYLVADPASKLAVVIDPAWDGDLINREAEQRGWRINQIWLTHAHTDTCGSACGRSLPVAHGWGSICFRYYRI